MSTRETFRRLWPWMRPYRRDVLTMIITDVLALAAQMSVPLLIAAMIDGPIQRGDLSGIWAYGGAMLGLGLVQTVMYVFRRRSMVAGLNIEHDLRVACYAQAQRLDPTYHDQLGSGQLIARTTGDLRRVRTFVGFVLPYVVSTAFTLIFVTAMLLRLHWGLGLIVLIAMAPMVLLSKVFRTRYEALSIVTGQRMDELGTAAEESALGIRVIKSYGRRRLMHQQFAAGAGRLSEAEQARMRLFAGFDSTLLAYPILILAAIVVGGVMAVANGVLTLGAFVAFTAFYFRLLAPVTVAGSLLSQVQAAATAFGRVLEVLDARPQLVDLPDPETLPRQQPVGVTFEDVGFSHAGRVTPILREVSLDIRPGETVALVGATGSGKTALVSLIGRLAEADQGRVLVGGVDVRNLALAELRSAVGVAFEDATLFSLSVKDNLTLDRPGITSTDIDRAIEVTRAQFVHELPHGLDTVIGEQGLSLSGGQRQRLALARALLGQPRVLVLDDPMSALDIRTEEAVERDLPRVVEGVTVLIVARRLSTALLADRVAVLDAGRIVEIGTHQDLMARSETYRWLVLGSTAETVGDI